MHLLGWCLRSAVRTRHQRMCQRRTRLPERWDAPSPHAGSLPGPGTSAPRVGGRVLKVKRLISYNKLPPLSGKRKFDCVRSGSRDLDSATKRVGIWKPSVQKGPIPMSPRADGKTHFSWISSVGEETMGEVTMSAPDNSMVCHRFRCTRSYTHDP